MRTVLEDGNGVCWTYDEQRALGLIRSYAFTQALVTNSSIVRTEDHWMQKIGLMQDGALVESDFEHIGRIRDQLVGELHNDLLGYSEGGWEDVQSFFVELKEKLGRLNQQKNSLFATAQSINSANIRAAETGIKVSRFVRDTSVVCISIIGAVATGGVTVALAAGAGGGLSAVGTYQDTGSISKAALSGGLSLVPLGVGKLGTTMKLAGYSKPVIVMTSATIDFSAGVAENHIIGDLSISQAVKKAAVSSGLGALGDQVASGISNVAGKRLRSVVKITDSHGSHQASNRLPSLIGKAVSTGGQKVIETYPGTPSEAATGQLQGLVPFAYKFDSSVPLMCIQPATQTDSPALTFVKKNILARV